MLILKCMGAAMPNWREVAALIEAKGPPAPSMSSYGLPEPVEVGLRRLATSNPRRVPDKALWRGIVNDATRLASEGWASNALALGWSVHDLFGVGPNDSAEWSSLAVWLAGRALTMMDDHRAFTTSGDVYYVERWGRPRTVFIAPVLLWEFGR